MRTPDPMVYPKGNPRYGSIETAGWTGLQKNAAHSSTPTHTHTHAVDSARPPWPRTCRCMQITTGMQWASEHSGFWARDWRLADGGLGIGDLQKLQLQPETGNAALLAALRATCESTTWVAATHKHARTLYLSAALFATACWINACSCVTLER